ncbi:ATP-binding cassette domain-containing protein [Rhodoferax sp. 4810]|nr:ATP-binding cassette domain-containing protein [Rhodoferax jenense]
MPPESLATPSSAALLQVAGLGFAYPQQVLFEAFGAQIPGGVTLLLGADGSGKTTLLRLLAGDLPASTGSLQLQGTCAQGQPQAYRSQVFWQESACQDFDGLTALEYFDQQRRRYPAFLPANAPQLEGLLTGLALTEHLAKPLYMLSTGSKRKVWLAAAFAAGAKLTLLDEPFAALDKPSIRFVQQQLALAALQRERAWVVAHYESLDDVPLALVIDLDV